MKTAVYRVVLALSFLAGLAAAAAAAERAKLPPVSLPQAQRALLQQYCVPCHNAKTTNGQMRLDDLPLGIDSVETAERWQKVLNVLNAGEMPPQGVKQPSPVEKTAFLDTLSGTMVRARKLLGDTGGAITMRRLNRREYVNTIRDLLGVTPDAAELPNDASPGTFDTVGSSLFFSGDQFEQYLALARAALDEAIVADPRHPPERTTRRTEVETAANAKVQKTLANWRERYQRAIQWEAAKGTKSVREFGFDDDLDAVTMLEVIRAYGKNHARYLADPRTQQGAYLTGYFPHMFLAATIPEDAPPGRYVLRVRVARAGDAIPAERSFMEIGRPINGYETSLLRTFQITGTMEAPQIVEFPVTVRPRARAQDASSSDLADRKYVLSEKSHKSAAARTRMFERVWEKNHIGPDPALWIDWVEVEGPLNEPWPPKPHQQIFFKGAVGDDAKDDAYAREIIGRFAVRAMRGRRPETAYVDRLLALYQEHRRQGESFEAALKEPLAVVLASPGFLYLAEPVGIRQPAKKLTDQELASRLSYFLWSGPPDEELLAAAGRGRLHDPAALRRQVDRMLRDPRSFELVSGFASQWLSLERLEFFDFNDVRYPRFDASVKLAARDEVYRTIETVRRENLGVGRLLKSDFVVVNGLLASYYGLEGVSGDEFRKVKLPPGSRRGGLLGMAAILAMGSDGERTSPVERGAWVLRKLLNEPPPPAPANVPQLSRLSGKMYSAHDLLAAHQEQPQCAQCHRKIDPIGFGLENFDAAGLWRTQETIEITQPRGASIPRVVDSNSFPIAAGGQMSDGTRFAGYDELRDLVAGRVDAFARGLAEALVAYGLGRPVSFSDEAFLQRLLADTKPKGYRMADLIQGIVLSDKFRMKESAQDTAAVGPPAATSKGK
jgi:hypothetical protein